MALQREMSRGVFSVTRNTNTALQKKTEGRNMGQILEQRLRTGRRTRISPDKRLIKNALAQEGSPRRQIAIKVCLNCCGVSGRWFLTGLQEVGGGGLWSPPKKKRYSGFGAIPVSVILIRETRPVKI